MLGIFRKPKCVCGEVCLPKKEVCIDCYYQSVYKEGYTDGWNRKPTLNLPPAVIKELVFLCHPDKHNNSERANEVTKWLLGKR
jgi:hypothetical protein